MQKRALLLMLTVGLLVFLIGGAVMAAYPEKGITFMVPYGTGGGTDVTARMLVDPLEEVVGVPVTVQNITGGGGWNGWSKLAHENPEGYFVGYTNVPNMFAGYLDPNLGRKENLESFTPIITHVVDPCIWAVTPDSPYQTLEELVEYASANPNKVSINAHGYGGDDFLAIKMMESISGVSFRIINNDSTATSVSQVLGGHIDVLAANVSEVKNRIADGELRALGVMWEERTAFLPDVPSFREKDYDVVMYAGRVISGPGGMPQDRVDYLVKSIKEACEDPVYTERMDELGLQLDLRTGDPLKKFLKDNETMVKKLMGWD